LDWIGFDCSIKLLIDFDIHAIDANDTNKANQKVSFCLVSWMSLKPNLLNWKKGGGCRRVSFDFNTQWNYVALKWGNRKWSRRTVSANCHT
jgi:hypothetical protein